MKTLLKSMDLHIYSPQIPRISQQTLQVHMPTKLWPAGFLPISLLSSHFFVSFSFFTFLICHLSISHKLHTTLPSSPPTFWSYLTTINAAPSTAREAHSWQLYMTWPNLTIYIQLNLWYYSIIWFGFAPLW